MGAILAKFLVRMLTYLLGLVVVLALVGTGAFVIARPQIDEFVAKEIKKRGLEVERWDLGLNGRANLHNIRMNLPDGANLQADFVSARPPFAGLTGVATLYNVRLERGSLHITIPELDISGIAQREGNPNLSSRLLQTLYQFDVGSLKADSINVYQRQSGTDSPDTFNDDEIFKFKGLRIEEWKAGKIGIISVLEIQQNAKELMEIEKFRSGAIQLRNIDIAGAYAWLTNKIVLENEHPAETDTTIVESVKFNDFAVDLPSMRGAIKISLGTLTSQSITLAPALSTPLDTLRNFVAARGADTSTQEKKQAQEQLLQLVKNLRQADVSLQDLNITSMPIQANLQTAKLHIQNQNSFIPEQLTVEFNQLNLDMTGLAEDIVQALTTAGYDKVEASFSLTSQWDSKQSRFNLENFSLQAKNIGDISVKLRLDHVDKFVLFQEGEGQDWLQKLRLHDFTLTIQDRGAIKNFVALIATIGGAEPEEIQQGFEDIARATPPILFEDDAQLATNAVQALLVFLQESGGRLIFHVTSREEAGIDLQHIMDDVVDWQTLLSSADISFSHEEGRTTSF